MKACLARPDADPSRLRGMDEYLIVFKNAIQTKPLQRYVRPWCTKPIRLERISLQLWGNAAQTQLQAICPGVGPQRVRVGVESCARGQA